MSLRQLELNGRIKRISLQPSYLKDQIGIASHNLASARRNLDEDPDLAYVCSYTAMLAAGRALMGALGYVPDGSEQHYSVELFLEHYVDRSTVTKFGVMRRKRHTLQYDQIGIISPTDAANAIASAEAFIPLIQSRIAQVAAGSGER